MSDSNAFVAGGGGFVRLRDSSNGFSAELNRQKKLEEERQRQKQAEQDRIARQRAEEEEKRRAANEANAAEAFREYHNNPASRGGVGSIHDYCKARFGYCYTDDLRKALAELNDPLLVQQFVPAKYAEYQKRMKVQQSAADLKADYEKLAKCKFCKIVFFTDQELAEHQRDTRPCPHRCGLCSAGGDTHRCSVYGASIIEDRLPVKVEEENGE